MPDFPDPPALQTLPPKRPRGVPSDNINAVKHGRHNYGAYSTRFGPRTSQNLDSSGLTGQIVLLKVYLSHLFVPN